LIIKQKGRIGLTCLIDVLEEVSIKTLKWSKIPDQVSKTDLRKLRFDVAIPRLRLLLEYHGVQHFKDKPRSTIYDGELQPTQQRDKLKKELADLNEYTLVTIPPSLDRKESLLEAAKVQLSTIRPELLTLMQS